MKKGFTLIEVLAVLVVMGLITTIVYVTVDKKVDRATNTAILNSARNYVRAVEQQFVNVDMESEDLPAGTYQVNTTNLIGEKVYASMNEITNIKENKPTDGYVTVNEDGTVVEAQFKIKKYQVMYSDGKYEITEKAKS